jgi:hypothetical protein
MKLLPWVSVTLSILSFFWIGFRREQKEFKERYDAAKSAPERALIVFWFLLPYLLGASGVIYLFLASLQTPPIVIRHHTVREIQGCGGGPVEMRWRTMVEVTCPDEHFSVSVKGEIFGPELEQLKERFGTLEAVHVYVVVAQEHRPDTKGLYWLQRHGAGRLDSLGNYESQAYLGGKGQARAKDGELFSIMIFIPDRDAKFREHTVYELALLPKPLFLSNPFYITTRRPTERSAP